MRLCCVVTILAFFARLMISLIKSFWFEMNRALFSCQSDSFFYIGIHEFSIEKPLSCQLPPFHWMIVKSSITGTDIHQVIGSNGSNRIRFIEPSACLHKDTWRLFLIKTVSRKWQSLVSTCKFESFFKE